jgi:hypothetical protein
MISHLLGLLSVPAFKALTGLPPYLGMLAALGVLWTLTDAIHAGEGDFCCDIPNCPVHSVLKCSTMHCFPFFCCARYYEVTMVELSSHPDIAPFTSRYISCLFCCAPDITAHGTYYRSLSISFRLSVPSYPFKYPLTAFILRQGERRADGSSGTEEN